MQITLTRFENTFCDSCDFSVFLNDVDLTAVYKLDFHNVTSIM